MKNPFRKKSKDRSAHEDLTMFREQNQEVTNFIQEVAKGNLQVDVSDALKGSELGRSLLGMKEYLEKIALEEKERSWVNTGLARFSDILRNKLSLDLKHLSDDILSNLVKYIGANQGALFVIDTENDESYLELISCYAYDRKKFTNRKIGLGEGLVGQCVLEKETIYLTETPADYLNITSGLGESTPRAILISPLVINENVFGVLEVASFQKFDENQREFISRLGENIASTIKNVRDNENTLRLLNASQQQAEELRSQEEEMRQNMEELTATQEEMDRKTREISRSSAELKGILKGIDATMASIEFTPDGRIITANSNFLKAMAYALHEIEGEHHRKFVPKQTLESEEYRNFWTRLAAGKAITGVFKRVASTGKIVWLNAIYNPITDEEGNVIKVIKYATDITYEQETLAESRGMVDGINATMATIEFRPDGTIIKANDNFLKVVNYTHDTVIGRHHSMFVSDEIIQSPEYKRFWPELAAGKSVTGIFKRRSSTGTTVWLNAIYNPITNAEGVVVKVVKFATDITREQEVLAESKGVLGGIDSTMATIEFKPDGTVINANANFLNSMKYSLSQIKGMHHKSFVPKDVLNSDEYKTFWKRLAAGESITGIFNRIDSKGSIVWLNAIYNPIRNANKEVIKVVKFATDITQQQELFAESRGILNGINTTMATIEFTPDGTVVDANENFLSIMQYTLDEIKGEHHRKFAPLDVIESEEYKTFWSKLSSGEAISGVFRRVSSSGATVWLNATYNPILNANGQVVKVIKFASDITTAQRPLEDAEAV